MQLATNYIVYHQDQGAVDTFGYWWSVSINFKSFFLKNPSPVSVRTKPKMFQQKRVGHPHRCGGTRGGRGGSRRR